MFARPARHRPRLPGEHRWRRRLPLAAVAIVAALFAVAVVAAGDRLRPHSTNVGLTIAELDRLPHNAISLGSPSAPVRLVVYADITSFPYTRFHDKVLPVLVRRYVRHGRLLIQLRTISEQSGALPTHGDARVAARLAQAAGLQGRFWPFVSAFTARYVGALDKFSVRDILRSIPR